MQWEEERKHMGNTRRRRTSCIYPTVEAMKIWIDIFKRRGTAPLAIKCKSQNIFVTSDIEKVYRMRS